MGPADKLRLYAAEGQPGRAYEQTRGRCYRVGEDDPGHARLIEKNLRQVIANKLVRFGDGQAALDYSAAKSRRTSSICSCSISTCRMDGYQVLRHLKADPRTVLVPVIS